VGPDPRHTYAGTVPTSQHPAARVAEVELVRILAEAATIEDAGERLLRLLARALRLDRRYAVARRRGRPPPALDRLMLEPGALLVLYTDGLVEEPGRPLADGLAQLARAATRLDGDIEAVTDGILADLTEGRTRPDDIAVLSLRSKR
jgi:hypothetical protein